MIVCLQLSKKYYWGKKAHIDVVAIIALKLTSFLWMQSAIKKTHYPRAISDNLKIVLKTLLFILHDGDPECSKSLKV